MFQLVKRLPWKREGLSLIPRTLRKNKPGVVHKLEILGLERQRWEDPRLLLAW